jgi:histidinol-phosphate/aromatic aminotransferase/cobyric acid decarboxylase-like protein
MIAFKVTDTERAVIEGAARKRGSYSLSSFIRKLIFACLHDEEVSEEDARKIVKERRRHRPRAAAFRIWQPDQGE